MEINTLHLVLDGFGCNYDKLKDFGNVYDFLSKLPDEIGMTKIMQPYVLKWLDKGNETEGLTGFVVIAESHLAVHTFPDEQRVYADVFSCKQFNTEMVEKYFNKSFSPKKIQTRVVRRKDGLQGILELNGNNGGQR